VWGPILAWIRRQIGQRTDAASATGSLHAKVKALSEQSQIKSIQRGAVSLANGATSATATISSVTTAKSVLSWLGTVPESQNDFANTMAALSLTNATTVTATRAASSQGIYVYYQVVEYY